MKQPASLLPEDFVIATRERRTALLAAALAPVMIAAVFAAFLVTNRQWSDVRAAQASVNLETERVAHEIGEMRSLEEIRAQMNQKAELARGLLEPVPRSVLLAILVNTMPSDVALSTVELRSEEIKPLKSEGRAAPKPAAKAPDARPSDPRAKQVVAQAQQPVRRRTNLVLSGYAPSLLEVGRWMGALERVPVFSSVRLELMEEKTVDGRGVSEFRMVARIEPGADLRSWKELGSLRAGRLPDEVATALAESATATAEAHP